MPRKVVLGYTELSNHSSEKAGADLLAKILNSSETVSVIQAPVASLSHIGFKVYRHVSFLTQPFDSLDEFVTSHGAAYTCGRVSCQVSFLVKVLFVFGIFLVLLATHIAAALE